MGHKEHAKNGHFLSYFYAIFVVDNEHANQGSQCSSVPTYTLVVHNVALYRLGGGQDDFCMFVIKFFNFFVLSVSVSVRLSVRSKWLRVQNDKCSALPSTANKTHETHVQKDLLLLVQGLCLCL